MSRPSQNPILSRVEKLGTQSKAYRASAGLEKKLAKKVGGRRTSGSGNKLEKGDVRVNGVARIEHKATGRKSFSVKRADLEKIELAGRGCDELPIFVVDFLNERGVSEGDEFAVIRLSDLMDLIDASKTSE